MSKDENGRYVFLAEKLEESYSFPVASLQPDKTGLACIIEKVKIMLPIEVEKMELVELTNAVVGGYNIPLFVFTYEDDTVDSPEQLLHENSSLSWLHSERLTKTLEEWEIFGMPQFL